MDDIDQVLNEFKSATQRMTFSYHIANKALDSYKTKLLGSDDFLINEIWKVIDTESKSVVCDLPNKFALRGMVSDGPISQIIAHGILSWMYFAWDDMYRYRIAQIIGTDKKI